jgi:acid phosphatase
MRRFIVSSLLAAAVAAVLPAAASARLPADTATAIPVPHPITTPINGVPMTELYDGGAGLPYLGATHPYDAGDWEPTLEAFHDSGLYDAELARIDHIADRWILRHHGGRHRRPAVVLDVDETSLSNYTAIQADNFTFGPHSQAEADDEIGQAIEPTLALYRDAKAAGVTPFFVTGRPESQRAVTADNLRREGYRGWKHLYLKPPSPPMTTVQYKSGARRDIERQGYRIIANIGDQYSDLAGGHARRAFKLANPFYFLP